MPYYREIKNTCGRIGIWKIDETADELLNGLTLSNNDAERFSALRSPGRKAEFLASRHLLLHAFGTSTSIIYNQHGKPFLIPALAQISISHSADFAVLFHSSQSIGIDIEREDRNVNRVCERFLHPNEKEFINKLPKRQRAKIICWSAKEAIYKCSGTPGISFKQQIRINAFNPEKELPFFAQLTTPEKTIFFELHSLCFENNVLVYCVEQKN